VGLIVSKRDNVKLQLVELPELSVTVIETTLSSIRTVPIGGFWVIVGFTLQLSVTVTKELKSVTINSQLELKYLFVFNGHDNIGFIVSNNVRLKSQFEKFPEASVIVKVMIVSEFTMEPIDGY
jgi:hypothetical protein